MHLAAKYIIEILQQSILKRSSYRNLCSTLRDRSWRCHAANASGSVTGLPANDVTIGTSTSNFKILLQGTPQDVASRSRLAKAENQLLVFLEFFR
jgi:hypothetical protein